MNPQRAVRWLAGLGILTAVAAVVAPRLMHFRGDGFGPAASAVLLFLALLAVACFLALAALVLAIRHRAVLSRLERVAGMAPAILLAVALAGFLWLLRF
jgi:hypothetical protein